MAPSRRSGSWSWLHVVRNAGGRASDDAIRSLVIWLAFSDGAKSLIEDVTRIRTHPLVPNNIPIYGYMYDVKTGRLAEVPEPTAAGELK